MLYLFLLWQWHLWGFLDIFIGNKILSFQLSQGANRISPPTTSDCETSENKLIPLGTHTINRYHKKYEFSRTCKQFCTAEGCKKFCGDNYEGTKNFSWVALHGFKVCLCHLPTGTELLEKPGAVSGELFCGKEYRNIGGEPLSLTLLEHYLRCC